MKEKLVLFFIIVLAFCLRFISLSNFPPGLTTDEVAIGYNAYSILNTAKDEWGQRLPLYFRSVGDYKPPVLIYLATPFVAIFGNTEIAVRLPVAIFSLLTVVLIYLTAGLFSRSKTTRLFICFCLAISPWHLFYARSSFEAIIGVFFLTLFVYLLHQSSERKGIIYPFVTFIVALISILSYHSNKVTIPLLFFFWLLLNKKKSFGQFITRSSVAILSISMFLFYPIFLGSGATRAKMTFLENDFEFARVISPLITSTLPQTVSHYFALGSFWFARYLEYFSPSFYLFNTLGLSINAHPSPGIIYPIELILLLLGILVAIKKHRFLVAWLFIGFLPASLANNAMHPLRSLNSLPAVVILIGLGLEHIWSIVNKKTRLVFAFLLLAGYIIGIARFADYYLIHYPAELSQERSYGWKEMSDYVNSVRDQYENIYVDHRFGVEGPYIYGSPHLYFMYFGRINPKNYQDDPRRQIFNSDYANFHFEVIDWQVVGNRPNTLYVGSPWSFPKEIITDTNLKKTVKFLDGRVGLVAISMSK